MSPGPDDPVILARRIWVYELRDPADAASLLEGARRIERRLAGQLAPLLGQGGFDSLWGRAIQRALRQCQGRMGASRQPLPDMTWETLLSQLPAQADPPALILSVLSHFLQLLWTFLGAQLGGRLVVQAWPPDSLDPDPLTREDGR